MGVTESKHADLLNAITAMIQSPNYCMRRAELRQAESLIVSQERQIVELVAALEGILADDYHAAVEQYGAVIRRPLTLQSTARNDLTH
jgi:hypothetical protein